MKTTKNASKKIVSKKTVSATGSVPVATAAQNASQDPGPAAPTGSVIPKPPTDWKPTKIGRGKGARARSTQTSNAAVAGKELGSSATYAADFGPHAPSQARLAHLIVGASAWRGQWVSSKRWTGYAAEQNADWWDAALEGASLFQPAFDYAVARDPSIVERYPSTTQFMQAASVISKRAATVRKANGGKKGTAKGAAAAQAAAPAPVGTSAQAATPDAAVETAPVVAATK